MLGVGGSVTPALTLVLVMLVTTLLANVVNKAAAIVMAPIAVTLAQDLGVSADPLLMGTAIGASCAFLTPVGHQVNMLVLGPGGYRFGDYWRLGLPLGLLVFAVSIPLILLVWPF
jgi:di/tricarboxylate transporter